MTNSLIWLVLLPTSNSNTHTHTPLWIYSFQLPHQLETAGRLQALSQLWCHLHWCPPRACSFPAALLPLVEITIEHLRSEKKIVFFTKKKNKKCKAIVKSSRVGKSVHRCCKFWEIMVIKLNVCLGIHNFTKSSSFYRKHLMMISKESWSYCFHLNLIEGRVAFNDTKKCRNIHAFLGCTN